MPVKTGLYHVNKKLAIAFVAVFLMALVSNAHAQERNYLIEVIMFENTAEAKKASAGSMYFPSNNGAMSLSGDKAKSLGFALLDQANLLPIEAQKIRDSGRYRMLKHFAWRQPGLDAKNAKPIRLNLGKTMAMYIPEDITPYKYFIPASAQPEPSRTRKLTTTTINGSLKLRLGRFLHLDTQLVFTDTENQISYRMSQSRKMRSNEFHYIDNPRFGLLVKIVPLEETAN